MSELDRLIYQILRRGELPAARLADNLAFNFGSSDDVAVKWTGSLLTVIPLTDDTGAINIGNGTKDIDFKVFLGTTAKYALLDVGNSRADFIGIPVLVGAQSNTATALALTASQVGALRVFSDDGGANIADSVRGAQSRLLLTIDQSAGTIRALQGQLKLLDGIDVTTGIYTAVQGYVEFAGHSHAQTGATMSCFDASVEIPSGGFTVDSGGEFFGVHIETTGAGAITNNGTCGAIGITKASGAASWPVGLYISSCTTGISIADDIPISLGTTVATAETKITMEFDETTTGIGIFNMGSTAAPMVLNTNPGATVIASTVNILHSAGSGDCDDLIASYEKVAVSGSGDSGLTVVGTASRAYVGTAGGSTTVASQCYGAQPWCSHFGTGAITAMSALSAKCDVNTGNFTATTVNAGHFHVEGASTVTAQFDGVMIEIYPDVTCLDSTLALMVDAGAVVTSAIRISGTMTNVFKFDVTTGVVTNALVPSAAPDGTTVGADKAIVCDIGGVPYYIALYDTLHA